MKQLTLSIEQMKHLKELGLDTSDASMWSLSIEESDWPRPMCIINGEGGEDFYIDRYTLADILCKLPKFISIDGYTYSLTIDFDSCSINYWDSCHELLLTQWIFNKNTLLNKCYEALIWCIENKFLLNKN